MNVKNITNRIIEGADVTQIIGIKIQESLGDMDYSDFYDIAEYGNDNWKGSFTKKELACNAYDYYAEYEQSVKHGRPTHTIAELYSLLKADDNDDTEYWLRSLEAKIDFSGINESSTILRDKDITSTDDVDELVLYIVNDGDIYRKRTLPIIYNLKKKYKKGIYDKDLVVKAFMYVADDGVRKYDKEFVSGQGKLFLDKKTREEIAAQLRDYYTEHIEEDD